MKKINIYLECNFATPANTSGMGNPMSPQGDQPGSGDIPIGTIDNKSKKKKKRKHLKEHLIESQINESFSVKKLLNPIRKFIMKNFSKKVGFKENIKICIQGDEYEFTATMDTGNGGVVPTLGVDKMKIEEGFVFITIGDKEYKIRKSGEANPHVGNVVHERPIIQIDYIEIKGRKLEDCYLGVTDQRNKSTKSLVNRDTMSRLNLIVDPSIKYTD